MKAMLRTLADTRAGPCTMQGHSDHTAVLLAVM